LLAEDNPINRKVVLAMLNRLGYPTDAVSNGRDCVEALSHEDYDLVLMDCQMPELDGYGAARLVRDPSSKVRNHAVPIVALTAHAMPGDRDRCLAAGMNDYLTKPIELSQLEANLHKWLAGSVAGGEQRNSNERENRLRIFDRDALLQRVLGDEALLRDVILTFLEDIPKRMRALCEALAQRDLSRVQMEAHTIKGASANLSAESLQSSAAALEEAAQSGQFEATVTLVNRLQHAFEALRGELDPKNVDPERRRCFDQSS
jgi:CheY-like chemotaxis protein